MQSVGYAKAFSELDVILDLLQPELKKKIPEKFINAIKVAKDNNYTFVYDKSKPLDKQDILPETKGLLSIVYSDYLCSPEVKAKWDEYDKFEMVQEEKLKKIKYNTDVFKNKESAQNSPVDDEKSLIVQEKWYKRIFAKLASLFGKK